MKITKITDYKPGYPERASVKKLALAGAAALFAASSIACGPRASGFMEYEYTPDPSATEQTSGLSPETTEAPLIMGDIAVIPEEIEPTEEPEYPPLLGKIVVCTETPDTDRNEP